MKNNEVVVLGRLIPDSGKIHQNNVIKLGNVYSNPKEIGGNGRGAIYDTNGICATLTTMSGGGNHPFVIVEVKK